MAIRFLFLVSLIFIGVFVHQPLLNAACDTDSSKDNALQSGQFVSCGQNGGQQARVAEFGIPQKPIDEDDPNSELTPIEPTEYNNPNILDFLSSSNVKFHFYKFLNNADITVKENSQLDLQLYNTTADIKFILLGDETDQSSISYRGGTTGKVSVYLNNTCNNSDCFRTNSNIDYLNFQGEITFNSDGSIDRIYSGGFFTVGTKNSNSQEESADITVNYITGNGSIELSPQSKLTIKDYKIDDSCDSSNANCFIQRIRGGYDSEVVFDTEIFIRSLEIPNATLNYYSKILNISSGSSGKYIFNANSDIQAIDVMHNIILNNNVHVIVQELNNMEEANISSGAILELLGETTSTSNNSLNKIQGEGTLWLHPTNWQPGSSSAFKITDVNLNNLIFDDGELLIENSSPNYTNTQTDSHGDTISSETVVRHIKNITRSDSNAIGGELTVRGTVIFDNIDYLNKLVICDMASSNNCNKNANLTIKKVNELNELEMNNGKLYLEITNSNNVDTLNTPALNIIGTGTFNGGEFIGVIKDTTAIKNKNTYWVIDSPSLSIGSLTDIFKTSLPDWYDYKYREDNAKLLLDVERKVSYKDIISQSSFKNNSDILGLASYFDSLISSNIPLGISAKTLTYLDLLSENSYDVLASNIQSLIPLSKNTYIKSTHFNMKEALDISKSKGIANTIPFGIWDKRYEIQAPKDNFWAVYSISNGKYDNPNSEDSHKSSLVQFGYNLYNWVSPNNREGQTFNLVGGFSKGNMNDYNYDTNISSFNIGGILDFRDENDILKFSLLYGLTSFDTQKDYFVSTCTSCLSDYPELKGSRLESNLNTHEILLDVQYSHEIFIEYLKSFAEWNSVVLTPRVYLTPSLLIGNKYTESGEISSVQVGYYTAPILESGTGFDLSKGFNFPRKANVKLFFTADGLYRYYKIPTNSIGFTEVPSTVSVGSEGSWSGFVINSSVGASFDYKSSQLSGFYKREIAKDYYQNIFGVSYRYLF